jgi:hypothetical protein
VTTVLMGRVRAIFWDPPQLDGEIRDTPRVRKIEPAARVEDLAKDLERSFGAGRDVWGTKEAEDYLKGLRRDS